MKEKTTLIAVAATLALLGVMALPSPPVAVPEELPSTSPAAPIVLERTSVLAAGRDAPRVLGGSRDAMRAVDRVGPAARAVHEAARAPLRLAIEGSIQHLMEPALATLGQGPGQADWIQGQVLDAFDRVLDRRAEIAIVAREPTVSERGRGLGEIRIGDLVLAVMVHPSNGIASLGHDQMRDLLRGGYRDWSDLGGTPGAIRFIAPSPGPTADLFARVVIAGDRFARAEDRDIVESDTARVRVVASDPLAFTVAPIGTTESKMVRAMRIDGELPTLAGARTGRYPFACPIVLGYADANSDRVNRFLRGLAQPATRVALACSICVE